VFGGGVWWFGAVCLMVAVQGQLFDLVAVAVADGIRSNKYF
jgi:hypothetical protein